VAPGFWQFLPQLTGIEDFFRGLFWLCWSFFDLLDEVFLFWVTDHPDQDPLSFVRIDRFVQIVQKRPCQPDPSEQERGQVNG
jgi:hypothetical protein